MKKILITYATAGIGHKKAAEAVKKALDEIAPKDVEVIIADALDYAPPIFKWLYLKLYLLAVNRLSTLWGLLYYVTDNFYVNIIVSRIRRFNNHLNSKRFVKYLTDLQPDVIVATHFFSSEVAADLKRNGSISAHLVTVVTDYRPHSWWVSEYVDTYVVGSAEARNDLIMKWKTPPAKVKTLGIPVEPIFSKPLDKMKLRERFGLRSDAFTILVIGGGFGVGPIEGIVQAVGKIFKPAQAIVICGHNEILVKKMESLKQKAKIPIKILGFVDNVYEFMEVADILISKSGGITVSESLAKDLPMIVISPIPGQETHNSNFLIANGAGVKADTTRDIETILEGLISHPEKIERMKASIRKIKRPRACYDIGKLALEEAAGG